MKNLTKVAAVLPFIVAPFTSLAQTGAPADTSQGGLTCATDDISKNAGSFLVVEADSLEDVKRFHDNDPFTRAGLFDPSYVVRWDRHIGNENQKAYVP